MTKEELENLVPTKGFCPAPFIHSWVNANDRGFKLCCMSKIIGKWDDKSSLKSQFNKFWTSNLMKNIRKDFLAGKYPDVCNYYCGKYEREGIYTQVDRLNFINKYNSEIVKNKNFKDINSWEDFEFNIDTGNKFNTILDLDIRPSNLCNLKCRSCNSTWSSEIQKEVKENPHIQTWTHWDSRSNEKTKIDWKDKKFDLLENFDFSKIYRLKITGGESLIDPDVISMIQSLVDLGYSKNIRFHTITNCTSFSKNIENLLKQFDSISFNMSVDAVGKVDDFLRHGQKWTKKVKNIQQMLALPNIHWAGIMHVCQPVSAFHLVDNMEYFLYLKRSFPKKISRVTFNPIIDPTFLHLGILDDDHKEHLIDLTNICIHKFEMKEHEIKWFDVFKSEIHKDFGKEKKKYLQNEFVKHQMELDKIRNTDTLQITPQLKRYFDRYDNSIIDVNKNRKTIVGDFKSKFDATK